VGEPERKWRFFAEANGLCARLVTNHGILAAMSLRNTLAGLPDDNVAAIEKLLATRTESIAYIMAIALSLLESRPGLAFRVHAVLARRPEPSDPDEREHWLRVHNNACHLAVFHGNPAEKREVVERALPAAPDNIAIYYNAACLLCQLGEAERALAAIRDGIARGYDDATIRAIADDPDLDLIRHTDAFRTVIQGHGDFQPPAWATGWTAWEVIQFREILRTTPPEPDLTRFDEGRIIWHGCEVDIAELGQLCKEHPPSQWVHLLGQHFARLLRHLPS
jgi:hypothetical protein